MMTTMSNDDQDGESRGFQKGDRKKLSRQRTHRLSFHTAKGGSNGIEAKPFWPASTSFRRLLVASGGGGCHMQIFAAKMVCKQACFEALQLLGNCVPKLQVSKQDGATSSRMSGPCGW